MTDKPEPIKIIEQNLKTITTMLTYTIEHAVENSILSPEAIDDLVKKAFSDMLENLKNHHL